MSGDIEPLQSGGYRWTIGELEAGKHTLRLFWSDAQHQAVAGGASQAVEIDAPLEAAASAAVEIEADTAQLQHAVADRGGPDRLILVGRVGLLSGAVRVIMPVGVPVGVPVSVPVAVSGLASLLLLQDLDLLQDLCDMLERLAPHDVYYRHDDFDIRVVNMHPDEPRNGHAHCRALLLPASACLNVAHGRLQLGQWQRIFVVELDGPRERSVSVMAKVAIRLHCDAHLATTVVA